MTKPMHEPPAAPPQDRWMTEPEAARYLTLSTHALRKKRFRGDGPVYARFGRRVAYRLSDLEAWAEARIVRSTSEQAAA